MDTLHDSGIEGLEARARLQVKVHRTLLRHQLIMLGNALLVGFLAAALLMVIWVIAISAGYLQHTLPWGAALFHVPPDELLRINLIGFVAFRFAALVFLLCPGLGLRICGGAMQP